MYRYLIDKNIHFENVHGLIVLDMFTDDPYWETISDFLNNHNISCQSNTVFSKADLERAEWLRIRCTWRHGYPQPAEDFGYKTITYSKEKYCCECGSGLMQQNEFRLKKGPNWGTKHFVSLNWVEDELFVDSIARDALETSPFTGFQFRTVLDRLGQESIRKTWQLVIVSTIKSGIIEETEFIRTKKTCHSCGADKYITTGIGGPVFRREVFHNACDIVKTSEIFGGGLSAGRMIIVKRDIYELLTKNGLARGLEFTPIELV